MTIENNQNTTQQQSTQQGAPTQPEDNGSNTEKMFTQEDVNRIVQERLARDRESRNASQQAASDDAARLADLERRENTLSCREYIAENNYEPGLLEILSTDNAEDFKSKVAKLLELAPNLDRNQKVPHVVAATRGGSSGFQDAIAAAFKPKI